MKRPMAKPATDHVSPQIRHEIKLQQAAYHVGIAVGFALASFLWFVIWWLDVAGAPYP